MSYAICNVVANPEMGKQSILLEQITDGSSLWRYFRPILSVKSNSSRCEVFQAGKATQDCRLSGAGRPEQNRDRHCACNLNRGFDARSAVKLLDDVRG